MFTNIQTDSKKMEPIKFKPLLKPTLWGGEKIAKFKKLACKDNNIGESWEVSGVKGSESIVQNSPYAGQTLTKMLIEMKEKLVGADNYRRFGDEFPLLVKFIDARLDLSLQVHPDDEQAKKKGLPNGKSEMWYIISSKPDAHLMCGLKKKITPEEYAQMVQSGTICDVVASYKVKEDDCFFIPSGRIHSIGSGCFLTEIQQTSDVTYRIYDFKRKDKEGNYRELHTKEAAECIDYNVKEDYRTQYEPKKEQGVQLVSCKHFTTAVYDLTEPMTLDYSELDSFVILIGIKGVAQVTDNEGNYTSFREGECILIPATTTTIHVSGSIKFLETYV